VNAADTPEVLEPVLELPGYKIEKQSNQDSIKKRLRERESERERECV
jgi:hypothetical protein